MIIQFRRNFPPYNAGERADFDQDAADRFIGQGIAQGVVDPAAAITKARASRKAKAVIEGGAKAATQDPASDSAPADPAAIEPAI